MKVRDQIAALAQFDPDAEVLPCFPEGMPIFDCTDLWSNSGPHHFMDSWPSDPREGDTVRQRGARFGQNRIWKRVNGQWVLQETE